MCSFSLTETEFFQQLRDTLDETEAVLSSFREQWQLQATNVSYALDKQLIASLTLYFRTMLSAFQTFLKVP